MLNGISKRFFFHFKLCACFHLYNVWNISVYILRVCICICFMMFIVRRYYTLKFCAADVLQYSTHCYCSTRKLFALHSQALFGLFNSVCVHMKSFMSSLPKLVQFNVFVKAKLHYCTKLNIQASKLISSP